MALPESMMVEDRKTMTLTDLARPVMTMQQLKEHQQPSSQNTETVKKDLRSHPA